MAKIELRCELHGTCCWVLVSVLFNKQGYLGRLLHALALSARALQHAAVAASLEKVSSAVG